MAEYRLLSEFRALFEGKEYRHRASNLGDFVAMHLYEDLFSLNKSDKYGLNVSAASRVLNIKNTRTGIEARRGDGTFGELIDGETVLRYPGFKVARGLIATVEIGIEVKIMAKAMIKQIDRVKSDLANQVVQFKQRSGSRQPICVGIVGVNHASCTTSYEGDRSYKTDGLKNKNPLQEAPETIRRLAAVDKHYDELLILRYRANNEPPYIFEWVDSKDTVQLYVAALIRICNEYQSRF